MNGPAPSQTMLEVLALTSPECRRKILATFQLAAPRAKAEIIAYFENGVPAKLLKMKSAANLN